jgi:hypothetical protein
MVISNRNIAAIQDLDQVVLHHASAAEVHTQAGGRFGDEKTCMWFDVKLQHIPEPSMQ